MSDRPVGVLVEDMLERIDRISRYTRGLDLQRQLRAYIFVARGEMWNVFTGRPTPNASPGELAAIETYRDNGPVAYLEIRNSGQTPAYDVKVEIYLCAADYPKTPPLPEMPSEGYGYQTVIPPQSHVDHIVAMDEPMSEKNIADLRAGVLAVYAWGAISYRDAFDAKVTSFFRFVHRPESLGTHELSPADTGTAEHRSERRAGGH